MNRFRTDADLTAKQKPIGGGMNMNLLFTACAHKGMRAGATFKGGVPWRCAACVAKAKAAKA